MSYIRRDSGMVDGKFQTTEVVCGVGLTVAVEHEVQRSFDDYWDLAMAVVWNAETGKFEKHYAGDYHSNNSAKVDAPSDLLELYRAWTASYNRGLTFANALRYADELYFRSEAEKRTVSRGKTVKVVRGRKVPQGTTGKVFWEGFDGYGKRKIGIALDNTKDASGRFSNVAWTAASNCEVVL